MTLPLLLRTSTIVAIGAVALAITKPARSEGGEGSSIVLPQAADSEASESVTAEPEAAVADEAPPPSKKTAKAEKDQARKTAETPASPRAKDGQPTEPPVLAASADAKQEAGVEETSPSELIQLDARLKPRQADIVRAGALKPLIAHHASENDVPFGLADAVVRLESRYNAKARNGVNLGLTQVNFRTAQSLGYKGDASGLLDADTNLRYGLKYLAMAYRLAGGDTCGTILRYQFGLRTQSMTGASRIYCSKVKTIIAAAE